MLSLIVVVFVVGVVLVMFQAAAGGEATQRPFNIHDLVTMDRLSDVQASPDGKRLAFCLRKTDLEKNAGKTDIWLIGSDAKNLRRLTSHAASSHSIGWSPDGKFIYFLSARTDSSQVWRIPLDGGEAEQVTNLLFDVGTYRLSPGGDLLAVTMEVFPTGTKLEETQKKLDQAKEQKHTGRVYDQLMFRHWDAWKDGRRSHIFVLKLEGGVAAGDPVDVTKGMKTDIPSKPFGGSEEYTFTPDGKQIVFSAKDVGRKEAWSTQFDLFAVNVDGKTKPKKVTKSNRAVITNPVFSPNGKVLACLAMARGGYEADRFRVALMIWPEGKLKMITESWDRSACTVTWSRDGRTIYTHADHLGQHPLFAVNAVSGEVTQLTKRGKVTEIAPLKDQIIYARCHHQSPVEIFSIQPTGGSSKRITDINGPRIAAVKMGNSEQFNFEGWNGDKVHAYVIKPVSFSPKKKYPVAFLIHGGPQGSFGNDFHYRWNPQVYAGAGYAVLMIDFHASTGYGQDFTDAINNHWGDRPVEDLQKGLAAALEEYPWMDADRIGALGASYGGYLINWIHGVWNDPFKCFVCHDGNIDERMAYYDTEELWFPEWERSGTPWEKPEAYSHHNPIDHVDKWCRPTLVIHGGQDYRVVDTQGMSTFTALQRRGIDSRFIYFPDENHWVLKPHNSIQWHDEVIGWLDKYLK